MFHYLNFSHFDFRQSSSATGSCPTAHSQCHHRKISRSATMVHHASDFGETKSGNDNHVLAIEDRVAICGWATDVVAIDHYKIIRNSPNSNVSDQGATNSNAKPSERDCYKPHTLLLFVPGNPGVVHWYIDCLSQIIQRLGRGFAARGVSYAGHGVGEDIIGSADEHSKNSEYSSYYSTPMASHGNNTGKSATAQTRDMSIPWTMEGQSEWILI